jgi:hypothetical protein
MNIFLKPLLLSTAFVTLGLCCTISHAEESFKVHAIAKSIANVNRNIILPTLTGKSGNENYYQQMTSFAQSANRPLLRLPLNDNTLLKEEIVTKGNAIFQAATIFNDKLHNFISLFQTNIPSNFLNSKDFSENRDSLSSCGKKNG